MASYGLSGLQASLAWRVMVGLGAVLPVAMMLLSLLVMPESPRHLVRKGESAEAARILGRLLGREPGSPAVARVMSDIQKELLEARAALSTRELVCDAPPAIGLMLNLVVTMAVAQHMSGVEGRSGRGGGGGRRGVQACHDAALID